MHLIILFKQQFQNKIANKVYVDGNHKIAYSLSFHWHAVKYNAVQVPR